MEPAAANSPDRARVLERAQAAAILLPAAVLAVPGPRGPLAGDLYPELTGTGIAALLAVPAAVLLCLRAARPAAFRVPGAVVALGLFVAACWISLAVHPPGDTLGASRAMMTLFVGGATCLAGAGLGPVGRAWLARGAVLLALWLLAPAFAGFVPGAGALGNSGATSEIALVGAAAGAWLFARSRGPWSLCGGAAALLHATYAGWAPALAGIVCLAPVLAASSLAALRTGRSTRVPTSGPIASAGWRATGLGLACVLAFGLAWVGTHTAPAVGSDGGLEVPTNETRDETAADLLGGEVRLRVWRGTARMVLDYGLLGAGPGQFGAAFPPYRDPRERAISSAPEQGLETEVEHAHDDWLQGFAEAGVGGLAWVLFLLFAGRGAVRAVRERAPERGAPEVAALGIGALAVLANAVLRSPLLFDPASSLVFGVLGAAAAGRSEPDRAPRPAAARAASLFALALVLISLPRAWNLRVHGRALTAVFAAGDAGGIERALAACPDSVQARSIDAQFAKLTGAAEPVDVSLAKWRRVLEVRPHRLVAWMEIGRLEAQAGDVEAARRDWSQALVLAPDHPVLCRNLARLEATAGDADAAVAWLERLGPPSPETLFAIAGDAVLLGANVDAALDLYGRADPEHAGLTPQSAWNLAQTLEESEPFRARWLEGAAHLAWAREHRAAGDFATAVRSYRQAEHGLWYRLPRVAGTVVADELRLELAACLAADGRVTEARSELADVRSATAAARAPQWVREALAAAGLDSPPPPGG